jgi:hypothetical protein
MIARQISTLALLLLLGTHEARTATLVVDAGRADSLTLAQAAAKARPGDTIWLAPNSGPYRQILHITTSGTATAPITVEGNDNEITGFEPLVFQRNPQGSWTAPLPGQTGNPSIGAVLRHKGERARPLPDGHSFVDTQLRPLAEWSEAQQLLVLSDRSEPAALGWEISTRPAAVVILNVSHQHYKNLRATGALNDGFNLHGKGSDLLFDHVTGAYNLDEGFSAHDQIECVIQNSAFHDNDNGIFNVHDSRTVARGLRVWDNLGIGIGISQGTLELTDSIIWRNGLRQLTARAKAKLTLDHVVAHTPPWTSRPWASYGETRKWSTHLVFENITGATTDGSPLIVQPSATPDSP